MSQSFRRTLVIAAAGAGVFVFAVWMGLQLTPEPRTQLDYLVIGSVATFLMLGAVFGLILTLWIKPRGFLGKRRARQQGEGG
jgi:hypothetical protein